MNNDASQQETVEMPAPSLPPQDNLAETVKASPPPAAEEAAIGQSPTTQPTLRVEPRPIAETQPTVPMRPAADAVPPVAPTLPAGEPPPFIRRSGGWGLAAISGWVLIAIGGVAILLLLLSCGLLAPSLRGMLTLNTLTPTATHTPLPTATLPPSPTATRAPTNTPVIATPTPAAPTDTPRPAPTKLEIGVLAKVTPPEGLKLKVRDKAGIDGQLLGELEAGAQVKIIDGPVQASGLTWWKVDNGQGLVGWSAEGSGGLTYLEVVGWAP